MKYKIDTEAVAKVRKIIEDNSYKMYHFGMDGMDCEYGYVLCKNEEELKNLVESNERLLYGFNYGLSSYKIEEISNIVDELSKVMQYQVREGKEIEYSKALDNKMEDVEAFWKKKENKTSINLANIILNTYEDRSYIAYIY